MRIAQKNCFSPVGLPPEPFRLGVDQGDGLPHRKLPGKAEYLHLEEMSFEISLGYWLFLAVPLRSLLRRVVHYWIFSFFIEKSLGSIIHY